MRTTHRMQASRAVRFLGGSAGAILSLLPMTIPAAAQTQLPGIVVTGPSPIGRQAPTQRPASAATPAPQTTAQAQPQPASVPAPSTDPTPVPPPGPLIVADDAFVPVTVVGLKGENLLDDDVRNHVSFKKDEVLQAGRTIWLFGSIKFN